MPKGSRTAVRIRPTGRRGSIHSSPTGDERIYLSGLIVLPRQFYEEGKGWVTIEGRDVYILASSRVQGVVGGPSRGYDPDDVRASDQFELDGETWQVDGPPADYEKGVVRKATLVRLKRVESS